MFEELVGKRIGVNMLFASYAGGFVPPVLYHGILLSATDEFLKVKVISCNINYDGPTKGFAGLGTNIILKREPRDNIMYFNVRTISSITVEE